jgi:hypothetical protein
MMWKSLKAAIVVAALSLFGGEANAQGCGPTNWNCVLPPGGSLSSGVDHNKFWGLPTSPTPFVNRLPDRTLMGAAVTNDNLFFPSGCPFEPCQFNFSNLDWLGQLFFATYHGGPRPGVFFNGNAAQAYILLDVNPSYPSPTTIGAPVGAMALGLGAQTANYGGGVVFSLGLATVNNALSGEQPAWGIYAEAHRVGDGSTNIGTTHGMELDVRNSVSDVSGWTPYSAPKMVGKTVGHLIACGAGLDPIGLFPCTLAMQIGNNPMPWNAGIVFGDGGLAPAGPGGTISAIAFPHDYQIQWYTDAVPNTLTATITAAANGILGQTSTIGFVWQLGVGGPALASLTNAGLMTSTIYGGASGNDTLTLKSTLSGTHATDFIAFQTGGAERMHISSNGDVGIGGAPDKKFNIYKDATYIMGAEAQVSISGVSVPAVRLEIGMDTTSEFGFIQATHLAVAFKNLSLSPGGGNVGIRNVNPQQALDVTGTIRQSGCATAGTLSANASGDIICTPSSLAFKTPLGKVGEGIADRLLSLSAGAFSFKDPTAFDDREHIGLYAEDVCAIDERLCVRDPDGKIRTYDERGVLALLIQAVAKMKQGTTP